MEFAWDDDKSDACFVRRSFDFAYAAHAFLDPQRQIQADHRWDYGEDRYQLMGRVDADRLERTTEADLKAQQHEDDVEALRDAARYARRVRERLGMTQVEFSRRIDVSLDTIRNWEQGKRRPTGAAKHC